MNERGYVALYLSELSKIRDKLNDADKAQIMNALADLLETGNCNPNLSPVGEVLWEYMYQRIITSWENYDNVITKRSEAGKKHKGNQYTRKKELEQMEQCSNSMEQVEQMEVINKEEIIKNKEENIKDKEINIVDKSTSLSHDNATDKIDYNGLMNFWNLNLGKYNSTLPQIEKMTDTRKRSVKKLIAEYGKETFWRVLSTAMQSQFLNSGSFKCGFDWVTKPANFIKILEGNYNGDNNGRTAEQKFADTASAVQLGAEFIKQTGGNLL